MAYRGGTIFFPSQRKNFLLKNFLKTLLTSNQIKISLYALRVNEFFKIYNYCIFRAHSNIKPILKRRDFRSKKIWLINLNENYKLLQDFKRKSVRTVS